LIERIDEIKKYESSLHYLLSIKIVR